jgi:hypothetical protein
VKLLLMAKQQITAGEASRTLGAFEWLFLGVRTLVPFQVFETSE